MRIENDCPRSRDLSYVVLITVDVRFSGVARSGHKNDSFLCENYEHVCWLKICGIDDLSVFFLDTHVILQFHLFRLEEKLTERNEVSRFL